ncbi:hypothetical protein KL86DYS2_10403 [uncultured Dysgonomonas sp.]|uniref:Uncharacterized protein n=1 Tax=uncultured Dysgonomonas sp. TaxID=206096 RepID=A0A212IZL8_9BACT|nr:hypothetical protein KL86DYS2_10403 [uncultured Dysgonomonas sp.]
MSTNNPLNAFGFLLQQQTVTATDFDPVKLNNPGARQDYSAKVEPKLPLTADIQLSGYSPLTVPNGTVHMDNCLFFHHCYHFTLCVG